MESRALRATAITLVFLLGCAVREALPMNVLISKERTMSDVNYVVRSRTDRDRGALVSWERQGEFSGTFYVRPRVDQNSGVLVNKPDPLDMEILKIIRREGIGNIEEYAVWLSNNMEYTRDAATDAWASPEETLERKQGDCEDFAFFNAAVLRVFGYKPKVLAMMGLPLRDNHAICAFEKDGNYMWFSNAELKKSSRSSMPEFGRYMMGRFGYKGIYEITPDKKMTGVLCGNPAR